MFKKPIKICAVIFVVAAICLCGCQYLKSDKNAVKKVTTPEAVNEFNFSVLKVGQADAIILQTENHSVIIDCGEKDDGDEILEYLSNKNIDYIDYLFITHFDKDHVGGVPEVINNIAVGQIITPDYIGNNTPQNNPAQNGQSGISTSSAYQNNTSQSGGGTENSKPSEQRIPSNSVPSNSEFKNNTPIQNSSGGEKIFISENSPPNGKMSELKTD